MFTDKLFTSQREMAGLGIYHYGARFHSPKLGRFLSADTIVPNPSDPQHLNRFSYVRNNPLRYIDPSGHVACRTQDECQDMGTTPGGGFSKPKPKPKPDNNGGGRGGGDYCSTHPGACGVPVPTIPTVPIVTPTPTPTPTVTPPILPTPIVTATGTPPSSFTQSSSTETMQGNSPACPDCILKGAAIIVATGVLEVIFVTATIYAIAYAGPLGGPVFAPFHVLTLNFLLVGIEYIAQGQNRSREKLDIDYFPIIPTSDHMFNPDIWK